MRVLHFGCFCNARLGCLERVMSLPLKGLGGGMEITNLVANESFGLPAPEAKASGIPVLTSNQASLPKVAGDAGIMVGPDDHDALRDAMLRLIEDQPEARRRIELGIIFPAKFTWRACAERTLAVYREAMRMTSNG
jgi:glycosyltransferase involved in cell wall biosynthesis